MHIILLWIVQHNLIWSSRKILALGSTFGLRSWSQHNHNVLHSTFEDIRSCLQDSSIGVVFSCFHKFQHWSCSSLRSSSNFCQWTRNWFCSSINWSAQTLCSIDASSTDQSSCRHSLKRFEEDQSRLVISIVTGGQTWFEHYNLNM